MKVTQDLVGTCHYKHQLPPNTTPYHTAWRVNEGDPGVQPSLLCPQSLAAYCSHNCCNLVNAIAIRKQMRRAPKTFVKRSTSLVSANAWHTIKCE